MLGTLLRLRPHDFPPRPLKAALLGRDLSVWAAILFFALAVVQVAFNYQHFANKPVPGKGRIIFPEELGYRNIDAPVWLLAGAMLPYNAPADRAMRPLYPAFVSLGRAAGLVQVPAGLQHVRPGAEPLEYVPAILEPASRLLVSVNVILTLLPFGCSLPWPACLAFPHLRLPWQPTPRVQAWGSRSGYLSRFRKCGYFASVVALAAFFLGFQMVR